MDTILDSGNATVEGRRKSTITCDMEGIIDTFNVGAEEMFGYTKEETIGKLRVSVFSPGEVVLQNLKTWLTTAVEKGEWTGETNFIRKNGEMFGARIRITPTWREGKQIGYCGVTEELAAPVDVPITGMTKALRWLVITRAPFLTAALTPCVIGLVWAGSVLGVGVPWLEATLTVLGVMLLHLAANVFNDYFDVKSGTDAANTKYFVQYSGGSRAVEMRLISLEGTKRVGMLLMLSAFAIGAALTVMVGEGVLVLGLAGLAIGYFYTAPPLRLVARRGLGELSIGMAFGPLITLGVGYVLTGMYHVDAFLAGIPAGLLTANILLINQIPDAEGDAATGKNHLVVTFGPKVAAWIYVGILASAIASIVWLAQLWNAPYLYAAAAIGAIYGAWVVQWMFTHLHERSLVKANINTIYLQIVVTVVMAIAMAL
jgi:1,4-dihydroxy-2-naphthoate polyprenyltransferase